MDERELRTVTSIGAEKDPESGTYVWGGGTAALRVRTMLEVVGARFRQTGTQELLRLMNPLFQLVVKPGMNIFRHIRRLMRGKNPNRNFRLPDNRRAAFAFPEMLFQFDANRSFELAVDVVRDLVNGVGAVQLGFLSRKNRSSFVRSFSRARSSRDFTAGTEIPIACAVSSVESSSISRSTNTVRKSGSSWSITWSRISCS